MNCVSCDICVYHHGLCVFFPGVFLGSRVTGACPVTTDLIMRVSVRTTTTTTKGTPGLMAYIKDTAGIPSNFFTGIYFPASGQNPWSQRRPFFPPVLAFKLYRT